MLPFDNKSEFQVIVDMPEGTHARETTARSQRARGDDPRSSRRSPNYQIYAGTAAPYNFNGLVRHYYPAARPERGRHPGEPVAKREREAQSHDDRQAGAPARSTPIAGALRRAHQGRRSAARARRCWRRWWPRSTARRCERGDRAGAPSRAICSSTPRASWMSIGTWKTTSRSTGFVVDKEKAALDGISRPSIARDAAPGRRRRAGGAAAPARGEGRRHRLDAARSTARRDPIGRACTALADRRRAAGDSCRSANWCTSRARSRTRASITRT